MNIGQYDNDDDEYVDDDAYYNGVDNGHGDGLRYDHDHGHNAAAASDDDHDHDHDHDHDNDLNHGHDCDHVLYNHKGINFLTQIFLSAKPRKVGVGFTKSLPGSDLFA